MATTKNNLLHNQGAVLVEHSDERLAAVEEAKRTGHEFQSVGARGADIVDRNVLREETLKVSNEGSTDPNQPMPDYLVELQGTVEERYPNQGTIELNRDKAEQHNRYSEAIVRAQQEAEVSDREKLRKDPEYFARRIAENNRRLAANHNENSGEYMRGIFAQNEGVAQEIAEVRPEHATDLDPVTALGIKSKVTDISERFAADHLQQKDRIIYGEYAYRQAAEGPRNVAPDDERNVDSDLTLEPMRVEEPVRNQKASDSEPANSPVVDASSALGEADGGAGNKNKPESARTGEQSDEQDDKPKRRSSKGNSKE